MTVVQNEATLSKKRRPGTGSSPNTAGSQSVKLRVQALRSARERRAWSLAIGRRGVITWLGVTAGNESHNASNARGVTAGKMGRNSSNYNRGMSKNRQSLVSAS